MADESTAEPTATTETPAAAPIQKKTRRPRTPKGAAEDSAIDSTAAHGETHSKTTRAMRGFKTAPVKAEKTVAVPTTTTIRAPRVASTSTPAATSAEIIDDIADLIKLEEENKQLRKELSEKLRAENAGLRKRLGQV